MVFLMPENFNFKEFLEQKRNWYKKIGKVFCPVLNEWVIFNAKGFRHLLYNGNNKIRTNNEQIYRLNTLNESIRVISQVEKVLKFQVRYSKTERREVSYWRIEKVVNNQLVTVILRKIGTGNITFYSTWRKRRKTKNLPKEIL